MKTVKYKIETNVEATIDGKPINEILNNIAGICHDRLRYSTSKQEGCEAMLEDCSYEDYSCDMEDRVNTLEGALCEILTLLGE